METFHRRSLPHWYMPHAAHFITYRLAGTLPAEVLRQLKELKEKLLRRKHLTPLPETSTSGSWVVFEAYERYLDQVRTINWLGNPQIASMIRQNLYYMMDQNTISCLLHHAEPCTSSAHAETGPRCF